MRGWENLHRRAGRAVQYHFPLRLQNQQLWLPANSTSVFLWSILHVPGGRLLWQQLTRGISCKRSWGQWDYYNWKLLKDLDRNELCNCPGWLANVFSTRHDTHKVIISQTSDVHNCFSQRNFTWQMHKNVFECTKTSFKKCNAHNCVENVTLWWGEINSSNTLIWAGWSIYCSRDSLVGKRWNKACVTPSGILPITRPASRENRKCQTLLTTPSRWEMTEKQQE